MDSVFRDVKEAVARQADAILSEYGIKHHRGEVKLSGTWTTGFLCPFCGDKSGSGSFTLELYLKCHQCSYKADVFDWLGRLLGKTPWEMCKTLGERCGIEVKGKPDRKVVSGRAMPAKMTDEVLEVAMRDLWDNKNAEPARDMLKERGLLDQRLLINLSIGWIKGWIIFARRNEQGDLDERYRGWSPNDPKIKWRWFGQGKGGPGIWPGGKAADGKKILLCEGEGDVLTAMCRLKMHEHGWHVATWTAGATSSPQAKDLPRSWHGREVHVAYDNDVFQGPKYNKYTVVTKPGKNPDHARDAAKQRLRKLLEGVCPTLRSVQCKVFVRECPVDPTENYGGDLRDWATAGGLDFDLDWTAYDFEELPTIDSLIMELPFDEVFSVLQEKVKTVTQVEAIGGDDLVMPKQIRMECEMGQHTACSSCPGARNFPDGLIDMDEFPRERVVGLESRNPNDYWARHVVQRPKGCPRLEIVTTRSISGSEWQGIRPGHSESTAQRTLRVISEQPPSLSGEVQVTGTLYSDSHGNKSIMHAVDVTALDRLEVDLEPIRFDLLQHTPYSTEKVEMIDEFLFERWQDLAFNVTRIHGRQDIQIAHDLLAHSAIEFMMDSAKQRGWLDICVFGETRSGKSITFRRMMEHYSLGTYHTAVSNISRAGLVMGADKQGLLKPGLYPRCNGKMLVLDEWHFLIQNAMRSNQDHPMTWMQSGRDEGRVSGIKMYGARDLPAKVRFCVIANWMRNRRRSFEYPCEHVGAMYGSPETLARLDFALPVESEPTQRGLDKAAQFWTTERCRALMLRAWSQEAAQVIIEPSAADLAWAKTGQWKGNYDSENLPLFTPEEKAFSVMRIAVAIANVTFSHVKHDPYSVQVRPVHVEWAARWLEHTWAASGYDLYSKARMTAGVVEKKQTAEKQLTCGLDLQDPSIAEQTLSQLLEPFSLQELEAIIGQERVVCMKWISKMQALRVFERVKTGSTAYLVSFNTTKGGAELIKAIVDLARNDHEQYVARYNKIAYWTGRGEVDVPPIEQAAWNDDDTYGQALPF